MQRDVNRLRNSEITEPLPPIDLPPEPNWEAIEDAIVQATPDLTVVEAKIKALANEISGIRRASEQQAINARRLLNESQRAYARLERQFVTQVQKTAEANQRAQEVRKATRQPAAPRAIKAKDIPLAPCWARSAEPAGKINCGCQGAPVAYACSHLQVGGFVTLHAAALRDTILRKSDGTQHDLVVKHLVPCSLCQYRGTSKDTAPLVSSIVLSTRTTICDACQRKSECLIPTSEQLAFPVTACPEGFWAAEAT